MPDFVLEGSRVYNKLVASTPNGKGYITSLHDSLLTDKIFFLSDKQQCQCTEHNRKHRRQQQQESYAIANMTARCDDKSSLNNIHQYRHVTRRQLHMTTISNLYILYKKSTPIYSILTPMSRKGVISCNDGKTSQPQGIQKTYVFPKFLYVPLGVGGWPLGYEEWRCWVHLVSKIFGQPYYWSSLWYSVSSVVCL